MTASPHREKEKHMSHPAQPPGHARHLNGNLVPVAAAGHGGYAVAFRVPQPSLRTPVSPVRTPEPPSWNLGGPGSQRMTTPVPYPHGSQPDAAGGTWPHARKPLPCPCRPRGRRGTRPRPATAGWEGRQRLSVASAAVTGELGSGGGPATPAVATFSLASSLKQAA